MDSKESRRLFRRVGRRQQVCSLGRRFYLAFVAAAGLYLLLLLISRLLALIPDWFQPASVGVVVAAALLTALLLRQRPTVVEAARLIDTRMGTHDLFLTEALIDRALGAFKPVVSLQAEARAPKIHPGKVLPYRWQRQAGHVSVALLVLLAGALFLPQLDPFGREAVRQRVEQKRRDLQESRKTTQARAELLNKKNLDAKESAEVQKAIEELKQAFKTMKPTEVKTNLQRLNLNQKDLGQMWRQLNESKLKDALEARPPGQRFGGDPEKVAAWKKQIAQNDLSGLKKEVNELKQLAKQMKEAATPEAKQGLQKEMKERLNALAECMAGSCSSQAAKAALDRAMAQLSMTGDQQLGAEALDALAESLQLSEQELSQLQQAMNDAQALEQALQTLQMARMLNQLQPLDGQQCQNCQGLADYARMYAEMCQKMGRCPGCGQALGSCTCQGQGMGQG